MPVDPGQDRLFCPVEIRGNFDPSTMTFGVYTYTVGTAPCDASSTVTVNSSATANTTITPGGPFCISDPSLNLSAADPGGTWSGNGITNAVNGTFDPATAGVGSHVITYTIAGACGNSSTETFVVQSPPSAGISSSLTVCPADPATSLLAQLGGTPDAGGTWTGPSALAGGDIGTFDPATNTAGTYTYTVTGTGPCPPATADVVVSFSAPANTTITPAGPFCDNNPAANLVANDPGGTWSGTGIIDPVNGVFDPSVAGPGTHTITYTITGGCGNSSTENIVVLALADATIAGGGPFCVTDAPYTFTGATLGGTWSSNSCGACVDPSTGIFDPFGSGPRHS